MGALELVDPANGTTRLFDFDDPTGLNNPYGVKTHFGLGGAFAVRSPTRLLSRFKPSVGHQRTVRAEDDLVAASWRSRMAAGSLDDLRAGVGQVAQLLGRGGTLKWTPGSEALYIDFEPSDYPALFQGQALELYQLVGLADSPQGIPFEIWRHPYLRGATLDPAANVLINPTLIWSVTNGRPDDWTWTSTTNLTAEAQARDAYEFNFPVASGRGLRQTTPAASAAPGEIWALSFYAESDGPGVVTCSARIEFLSSASSVLATWTGSTIIAGAHPKRVSIATEAAPASTDRIRVALQVSNTGSASTVRLSRAQLEPASAATPFRTGAQAVANNPGAVLGRGLPVYVHGNAPTRGILRIKADAAAKLTQAIVARRSNQGAPAGTRKLSDYLNSRLVLEAESGTLTNETTATTDTAGSPDGAGNTVARTLFTTNPTVMNKRVRLQLTTLLDCLRGSFDVYCRLANEHLVLYTVQLRWAPSLADPAPYTEPELELDFTNAPGGGFLDVRLGRIHLPEDPRVTLAGLALELWGKCAAGGSALRWDALTFVPADESVSRLFVPGSSEESWLGKTLITPTSPAGQIAGAISGNGIILNANTEAAGTAPNAGFAWPVGRHRVYFRHQIQAGTGNAGYTLAIRNVTDGNDTASKALSRAVVGSYVDFLEIDSAAGKSYQPQVRYTAGTRPVRIDEFEHQFVPYVTANESLRSDPVRAAVEKLDSNGALRDYMAVEGAIPLELEPGLNVVYMHFGDVPRAGFAEHDSVFARAPIVSVEYSPRYLV